MVNSRQNVIPERNIGQLLCKDVYKQWNTLSTASWSLSVKTVLFKSRHITLQLMRGC